jgi:hypothetical protein
MYLVRKGLAQ